MKLCRLIEDEYTNKGVTDSEFAKYAESTLKFSVTQAQVMKRRDELGISSTWHVNAAKRREEEAPKKSASIADGIKRSAIDRIKSLEERVGELETKLADLLK
jgi:hypothetical protein